MAIRVLIADETEVMRVLLRLALESAGYEVVAEATTGEEAIALYKEHRPDVLTIDLKLGEMGGLRTARRILKFDPDLCFVVCTAQSQEDQIRLALEHGARDFVIKPFEPERIIQAMRTAVSA